MGAVFVSGSANAPNSQVYTNTVGAPGGLTPGNILLAFCGWLSGNGYNPNPVTSPGWSFVDSIGVDLSSVSNSTVGMTLLTKTVSASEPGTYTFTYSTVGFPPATTIAIVQYTPAAIDGFIGNYLNPTSSGGGSNGWNTVAFTAGDPADTVVIGLAGIGLSDPTTTTTIPTGYTQQYRASAAGAAHAVMFSFDAPAAGTAVAGVGGLWIGGGGALGYFADYAVALKGTTAGVTVTGTASLAVGPVVVEVGSGGSSGFPPIIGVPTVTGAAVLNIGPLVTVSTSRSGGITTMVAVRVGPVGVAALGGRIGPGAWPVPEYRSRWRLTLHTRAFSPKTLAQTLIAELVDARGRRLDQVWNTPAALTFTLDGRSQSAGLVQELLHDVVAWRWDDQVGSDIPVFRGPITQSEDQITTEAHTVTYTCHDYAAVLGRRLVTATYSVTGRDQDLIVGDLLGLASSASTSSGTSLTPASFLPVSLLAVTPAGVLRGLSGQLRNRTYYGSQNIGTAIDDLSKVANGYDYDVIPSAVDDHDSLRVFYPQQGVTRTGIALQYGSTVATLTRSINSADYANYVRVLGNNTSASPTPQLYSEAWDTTAHSISTTPVGLWMTADDNASDTVQSALDDKAAGDLNYDAILDPAYTLTMTPDAYTWGNPNMGDIVPLIVNSGRLNVNTSVRVLGISYDIGDDGQEDVILTVTRPQTSLAKIFRKSDRDVKALARR